MSEVVVNEQLQQALVEVITKAVGGVEGGVGFLNSQLPDVLSQILQWGLLTTSLAVLLNLVALVSSLFIIKKVIKKPEDGKGNYCWEPHNRYDGDSMTSSGVLFVVLSLVLAVTTSAALLIYLYEMLQIMFAPKIYLIEYTSHLMKG